MERLNLCVCVCVFVCVFISINLVFHITDNQQPIHSLLDLSILD